MLAVRSENPIELSILLEEESTSAQGKTLRKFLMKLRDHAQGTDPADGTAYAYSRTVASRLVKIKASRSAWDSSWTAEIRVISSDLWHDMQGEVFFQGVYLVGPTTNVAGQAGDAEDAALRIAARLDIAIDALIATSEFVQKVSR